MTNDSQSGTDDILYSRERAAARDVLRRAKKRVGEGSAAMSVPTPQPSDVLGGLPRWVLDLIVALDQYEECHPKFDDAAWGCVKEIADLIPDNARRTADLLVKAGVLVRP